MRESVKMPHSEWKVMSESMRDNAEGERLDKFHSEEEFLAAATNLSEDETGLDCLTARLWRFESTTDFANGRKAGVWYEIVLTDEMEDPIWRSVIDCGPLLPYPSRPKFQKAFDEAVEFAAGLPASINWEMSEPPDEERDGTFGRCEDAPCCGCCGGEVEDMERSYGPTIV